MRFSNKYKVALFAALIAGAAGSLSPARALGGNLYPPRTGAVNDGAGLLSEHAEEEIVSLTGNLYKATGEDIAVLTVKGRTDERMGKYCEGARKAWMPGRSSAEGALLVFAPGNPRSERVCVTTDFELNPAISRAAAAEIAALKVQPWADRGDYGRAALAGVLAVARLCAKSHGLTIEEVMSRRGVSDGDATGSGNWAAAERERRGKSIARFYYVWAVCFFAFAGTICGVIAKRKGLGPFSKAGARRWRIGHAEAFGAGPDMFGGYGG